MQRTARLASLDPNDGIESVHPAEHAKRLDELAAKKGVSKSSIVAAALASWLSPDAADQREAAIAKRLDRLSRQAERMERDQNIAIETLALFIRYYLTVSTPVPEAHQDAARAQGKRASSSSPQQPPPAAPQPGARRGGGTASRPDADGRRGGSAQAQERAS